MKRKFVSVLLVVCMVLSMMPASAREMNEGSTLCIHHPEHDEFCGYVEAVEGHPCAHEHTDACYQPVIVAENKEHIISTLDNNSSVFDDGFDTADSEQSIITKGEKAIPDNKIISNATDGVDASETKLDCQHIHDETCGFVEAVEGRPCSYICEFCNVEVLNELAESESDTGNSLSLASGDEAVAEIWDGTIADSYDGGEGTSKKPYLIRTATQLARIAEQINSGLENEKYYRLTADIYLNDISTLSTWNTEGPTNTWTPIGNVTSRFSGSFDGNNYKIYGLYISTNDNYQGLFGYAAGNSAINNVGIEKSYIKGGNYVGAIVGYRNIPAWIDNNKLTNCHNSAKVTGIDYVGGILGGIEEGYTYCDLGNSYNTGEISGNKYVGGIIGYCKSIRLENCYNTGAVKGAENVGGIAGNALKASLCWNIGTISGNKRIGGILGEGTFVTATSSTIERSFNVGTITAESHMGGIVGYTSTYGGRYTSTISNCYNIGSLTGTGEYVAGIAGYPSYAVVTNCYNAGTCIFPGETSTTGGAIYNHGPAASSGNLYYLSGCLGENHHNGWSGVKATSNEVMHTSDFVSTLNNGGNAWVQDTDEYNSGYPILSGIDYEKYNSLLESIKPKAYTIVEAVRRYTSAEKLQELQIRLSEIDQMDISNEEKMQLYVELFGSDDVTEIREGIKYLVDCKNERASYLALMSDDMYCAYNFQQYVKGNPLVQANLLASSLIFGGEINDWLDFSTYLEGDFPGIVKYKKMLLNYMDYSQESIKFASALKTIDKLLKNTTSLVKDTVVAEIEQSCASYDAVLNYISSTGFYDLAIEGFDRYTNNDGKIIVKVELSKDSGIGRFAENVKTIDSADKLINIAVSSFSDFVALNSTLELYEEHKEFLTDVTTATQLPFEMRFAADQLLKDLEDGYLGQVIHTSLDIVDWIYDTSDFKGDIMDAIYEKFGLTSFKSYLTAVNATAWFINKAIDIDAAIEASAITEAYAKLATYYKSKLEASKAAFLKAETEENAWKFYLNYTILWNLRYAGEKSYLDMCNMEGLLAFLVKNQYKEKENVVNVTFSILERSKFVEIAIGGSGAGGSGMGGRLYAAKSIIECPVDIEIYDNTGTLIASLKDGKEQDISNEYGRFISMYRAFNDDFVKILYWNSDSEYMINLIAVTDCLVSATTISADNTEKSTGFYNIPVSENEVVMFPLQDPADTKAIKPDGTLKEIPCVEISTIPQSVVNVSGISIPEFVELEVGETIALDISITPANATYQDVEWFSNDNAIAQIKNGVVTAIKNGTAQICGKTRDGEYVAICTVTVGKNIPTYALTVTNGTGGGSYEAGAQVSIAANAAPEGKQFDKWTSSNGGSFADASAPNTIFTMPASDTSVTATYKDIIAPPVSEHIHNWAANWTSDETYHWHECNAKDCPITSNSGKDSYAAHTSDSGAVTTPATADTTGTRTYSCTICGHILKTESIPATGSGSGSGGGSSGGGGYHTIIRYPITASDSAHGSVKVSHKNASKGTAVTITAVPDTGYTLEEAAVTDNKGNELELTDKGADVFTFAMPASAVNVKISFVPAEVPEAPWSNPFADVAENAWCYEAVQFVCKNGLMGGYGNGLFGVNDHLSRAQLAQILYNKEGRPFAGSGNSFTDVGSDAWCTDAITWAAAQSIVNGYGNGKFGPNDPITREQLAVMLWRHAGRPTNTAKDLQFNDEKEIGSFALEAMCWAVENGIINGYSDGHLGPKGFATRAQAAQMLKNYLGR